VIRPLPYAARMRIISCDLSHAESILAIFNDEIANSTAIYDYEPRTMDYMRDWFAAKARGGHPVLGAIDEAGTLAGFATFGPFRNWPAYQYTVEHSVYVASAFRGRGISKLLMPAIIEAARARGYHVMVGVIDAANSVSKQLHERFGFAHAGTIRHAGYKFERWLDVDFYQLMLDPGAA
jgi:L-amino acid N-acyltransferase